MKSSATKCEFCRNRTPHPVPPSPGRGEKKKQFRLRLVEFERANPWYIMLSKFDYCFWVYLRRTSTDKGVVHPHSINEIAKILGLSPNDVHSLIKKSIAKLVDSEEKEKLRGYA